MPVPRRAVILLLIAFNLRSVIGKFQTGSLLLGTDLEHQWHYLSKFGFGIGAGDYSLRMRLREPMRSSVALSFDVFLDEDWGRASKMAACKRAKEAPARTRIPVRLPAGGDWSKWESGEVKQVVRPHVWYFAISNCGPRPIHAFNATYEVDFELVAHQGSGSEFSVEMDTMLPANAVALVAFSVVLLRHGCNCCNHWRGAGSVHVVIWVLTAAMLFQFMGQVLHTLHLWQYSFDGEGEVALSLLSEISLMLSQVIQTTLLITIALGYTLLYATVDDAFTLIKPVTLVVCVMHVAFVAVGKMQDDSSTKFHEQEGAVGWALVVCRLGLYAWFLMAVKASQEKGGFQLRAFMQRFCLAGSLYFLAYPAIFCAVQLFAPYIQHPILHTGLLSMQTASHFWLAGLFLSRGAYFKVSTLNSSHLPRSGSSTCGALE